MSIDAVQVVLPEGRHGTAALAALRAAPALPPFAPGITRFVVALSDAILRDPSLRGYPESVAFGYWMRGARLRQMAEAFARRPSTGLLSPRGVAFHIAPSNVDTIFLYSLMISLLVGNRNVVRLSSKKSEQVERLVGIIAALLAQPDFAAIRNRLLIVRYDHSDAITQAFSDASDIRVIWGGDGTVNAIRKLPMPPRAVELTFADKVSLAVIDATAYLGHDAPADIARLFANDAYWFGQMACSSPRLVVWRGAEADMARASERFWSALEARLAAMRPDLATMDFMNKLVAEQTFAAVGHGTIRRGADNMLNVIRLATLKDVSLEDHCGGGIFLESRIGALDDLLPIITPQHQTVASHGIRADEWRAFIDGGRPRGIDRIVPFGEALTFAPVWDGIDLFGAFCREVTIGV